MGMYDHVLCEVPLPAGVTGAFRTKDFDPLLCTILIRSDGRLLVEDHDWEEVPLHERPRPDIPVLGKFRRINKRWRDLEFHGDLKFYGPMQSDNLYHFRARFTHGNLERVFSIPDPEALESTGHIEQDTAIASDRDYLRAITEVEARWDDEGRSAEYSLTKLIEDIQAFENTRFIVPLLQPLASPATVEREGGEEVLTRMSTPVTLTAFVGWRSATAALRAFELLCSNDPQATAFWMNQRLLWSEFTPLQLAEQGDEGLQMVLDHLARIDAGVFY